ncbi:MAG: RsmD family RNA methyltransferase [Candidatus Malihini olakiniferum]
MRPNTERIREILFNSLAQVIQKASFLQGFRAVCALRFEWLSYYSAHICTLLRDECSVSRQHWNRMLYC